MKNRRVDDCLQAAGVAVHTISSRCGNPDDESMLIEHIQKKDGDFHRLDTGMYSTWQVQQCSTWQVQQCSTWHVQQQCDVQWSTVVFCLGKHIRQSYMSSCMSESVPHTLIVSYDIIINIDNAEQSRQSAILDHPWSACRVTYITTLTHQPQ